MIRAAVDCHMVGAPAAGDAGNARYAAGLARALALTAPADAGAGVAALVAHAEAQAELDGVAHLSVTPQDVRRLAWGAPRALAGWRAEGAVFTYVAPPRAPCAVALAVHDASFVTNPEWLGARARAVLGALVRPSARRAGTVLALSQTARADVAAALGLDADRMQVVPPYPAPHFAPATDGDAGSRVHARFGLGRYVLAVGDINPRKNLASLVAAMARLSIPGLELALVGRRAATSPSPAGAAVRWLGRVRDDELADLYRAAAVTAYPSLYEGFGLPVVEAMACGCPVVASDRGAIPEVAGGAAILTPPAPEAIAEAIAAALEPAEAERLRAAGLRRARAFTPEITGRAAWSALAGLRR